MAKVILKKWLRSLLRLERLKMKNLISFIVLMAVGILFFYNMMDKWERLECAKWTDSIGPERVENPAGWQIQQCKSYGMEFEK